MRSSFPFLPALAAVCSAFAPTDISLRHPRIRSLSSSTTRSSTISLRMSSAADEDEESQQRRMEMVRSLQRSFYASGDEISTPTLNRDSGILSNLPLWRVQWSELPGRSNVLNVHEGTYTNCFEKILNGPKPWYVGHLFLPGGSENLKPDKYCYELKTWREEADDEERKKGLPRSSVVGTLLEIVDSRRLTDGRLLLLVHAVERFVVERVVQKLPYSIADVQILPDTEELDRARRSEGESAEKVRARAAVRSFDYHDYEYDSSVRLPIPESEFLDVLEVYGPDLGKVLPFVPYAKHFHGRNADDLDKHDGSREEYSDTTLLQLSASNILREPPSHPELMAKRRDMSVADLEDELWQTMEEFCHAVGLAMPTELLRLLPPGRSWPDPLTPPASASAPPALSSDYPNFRRQRRLSFSASAFLEQTSVGAGLRQMWLETPDTRSRLVGVLERYNMITTMM